MPHFSQAQLQDKVSLLVSNGRLDEVTPLLTGVGYGPENLDEGGLKLQSWLAHRDLAQKLLMAQKMATQAEKDTKKAAGAEVSQFKETARVVFEDNEAVLTRLYLYSPRKKANGSSSEKEAPANGGTASSSGNKTALALLSGSAQVSTTTATATSTETSTEAASETNGSDKKQGKRNDSRTKAALVADWRRTLAAALGLEEAYQVQLAEAGWPLERLEMAAAQVETYAGAAIAQTKAIRDHDAQMVIAGEAEGDLRAWYSRARRLARLALKKADPKDRTRLKQLLGL